MVFHTPPSLWNCKTDLSDDKFHKTVHSDQISGMQLKGLKATTFIVSIKEVNAGEERQHCSVN